jgi:hypothetical protein
VKFERAARRFEREVRLSSATVSTIRALLMVLAIGVY